MTKKRVKIAIFNYCGEYARTRVFLISAINQIICFNTHDYRENTQNAYIDLLIIAAMRGPAHRT